MSPCCTRLPHGRYSIAWYMPVNSRPGTGRSRHAVAPPASTTASNCCDLADRHVLADVRVRRGTRVPSALHLRDAAVEVALLHLELGDAVAQQPADAVGALEHGHVVTGARELLRGREARPGPLPTTATRLPVLRVDDDRRDQPSSHAAVDDLDLDLLDRDRRLVDAEHARGFARRRAQPAGELGEVVGRVQALDRRVPTSRYTRSFHSGMRFPSGQPVWQNGMPQSMQRAPCVRTFSGGKSS